ncbi:RNA polymerase sigma factor [Sphingosinicella rhizophila]|uniref:Sigma-70 family RNA polymerase sigma factor n=1 Tax=Sphingosinicella rhizophila TaxID=3050082 RepID=A0ABU3QB39_9SPHN|nr:sigma-70 family RNA polymerase sigma factor [Sphingosinicella sp. GR2756]MDT9600615.1 sigma-70 family RNA polymerase sigma factor [Sphingosinicella sp. GR2756]
MSESSVLKWVRAAQAANDSTQDHRRLTDDLYRRYWEEICRYVRRSFGAGPPDPEDVAQIAFTKFAALSRPRDILNPRAFLYRTAHNAAADWHRQSARAEAAKKDPALANQRHEFTPEDILMSRDGLLRLDAALAKLKPRQRTALLLHRVDGLSFAEIARRMQISPSGARKLVEQGFARCAESMRRNEL